MNDKNEGVFMSDCGLRLPPASQTEQAMLTVSDLCLCPGVLSGSGYHGPLTLEAPNKYDPYECTN